MKYKPREVSRLSSYFLKLINLASINANYSECGCSQKCAPVGLHRPRSLSWTLITQRRRSIFKILSFVITAWADSQWTIDVVRQRFLDHFPIQSGNVLLTDFTVGRFRWKKFYLLDSIGTRIKTVRMTAREGMRVLMREGMWFVHSMFQQNTRGRNDEHGHSLRN